MAVTGELAGLSGIICDCCGTSLPLEVLESAAGYYLGYACPRCGPYSRETGYYASREEATAALNAYKEKGIVPHNIRRDYGYCYLV